MATIEISEEAQEDFLDVYSSLYDESPVYADFWEKEFLRKFNYWNHFQIWGELSPK